MTYVNCWRQIAWLHDCLIGLPGCRIIDKSDDTLFGSGSSKNMGHTSEKKRIKCTPCCQPMGTVVAVCTLNVGPWLKRFLFPFSWFQTSHILHCSSLRCYSITKCQLELYQDHGVPRKRTTIHLPYRVLANGRRHNNSWQSCKTLYDRFTKGL